jgi:hypothetical protein
MSDVTTGSMSETKTTQSFVVFRAKNNNTYNRKKESKLLFHISYKIDIIRSFTTRTLCGLVLYVDWNTPFELVTLNEMTKAIFFIEESKKKGNVTRDITSLMCQSCLANVSSHLLTKKDRERALSTTPIEKNIEEEEEEEEEKEPEEEEQSQQHHHQRQQQDRLATTPRLGVK